MIHEHTAIEGHETSQQHLVKSIDVIMNGNLARR